MVAHAIAEAITYPDGSTNQPVPKKAQRGSALDALFDLRLDRTEVHDGVLLTSSPDSPRLPRL